jgi:hydroxymethylglutaryl-CoA reductase
LFLLKTRQKAIYHNSKKGMGQPHVYGKDWQKSKSRFRLWKSKKEIVEQMKSSKKQLMRPKR